MANKVALVPIFGVDSPARVFQLCERSIKSFVVEKRNKTWTQSLEWNILIDSDNLAPESKFRPLVEFSRYSEDFTKIASSGNTNLKRLIRQALALQWNDAMILSPVKRRPSMGASGESMRVKVIVLVGSIAEEEFEQKLISTSFVKWARDTEVRLVHIGSKKMFNNIEFIDSSLPVTRLSDIIGIKLVHMANDDRVLATPEGVSETLIIIQDKEYKIKVSAREKIKSVEIRAELTSNGFVHVLSHIVGSKPFPGTCSANVNKDLIPLEGKMFIVRLNGEDLSVMSISRPISSKLAFAFRRLQKTFKLENSSCRLMSETSYSGDILSATSKSTIDMTRFEFSYLRKASDNSGKGVSLLEKKMEELGKLSRKEGLDHENILPRKLRVRSTPTKTPMKSTPTGLVGTPRRTPSRQTPSTPSNENRELKRLTRTFPETSTDLEQNISLAMRHNCYVTTCRLCLNFMSKHSETGLKQLRKTKDQVFDKHGAQPELNRICKLQLLYYLLDPKTTEIEYSELGTLMRWFTFSSSSADLNLFFEETVIPIWLEKDEEDRIKKLLEFYEMLMMNVPKILARFVPNSDSESESDDEDVITVEPSSVSTSSIISSSMSIFSNNSRVDNPSGGISRKFSNSNALRQISVRQLSEPVRKMRRANSTIVISTTSTITSHNSDRAKRALFATSPETAPKTCTVKTSSNKSSLPKPRLLKTKSVKDTPLKLQEVGSRSARAKFRCKRKRKNSLSGVNSVAESPGRQTKFTGASNDVTINLDQTAPCKTVERLLKGETLNSIDLFSPPRDGNTLLFGANSSASSSDDEFISNRKDQPIEKVPPASISFVSPIRADENTGTIQSTQAQRQLSCRRKLTSEFGSAAPLAEKDDLLNKSFEALVSGEIIAAKHDRLSKFPEVRKARRQLKLSESEK